MYLRRKAYSAVFLFGWLAEHVLNDLHRRASNTQKLLFSALQQQSGRRLHRLQAPGPGV